MNVFYVRILNAFFRWRFHVTHRYAECERCCRKERYTAHNWEWAVTNFAIMCRTCRADFEAEQLAHDREDMARRSHLSICVHCFAKLSPLDLVHVVEDNGFEYSLMCDPCWRHSYN